MAAFDGCVTAERVVEIIGKAIGIPKHELIGIEIDWEADSNPASCYKMLILRLYSEEFGRTNHPVQWDFIHKNSYWANFIVPYESVRLFVKSFNLDFENISRLRFSWHIGDGGVFKLDITIVPKYLGFLDGFNAEEERDNPEPEIVNEIQVDELEAGYHASET